MCVCVYVRVCFTRFPAGGHQSLPGARTVRAQRRGGEVWTYQRGALSPALATVSIMLVHELSAGVRCAQSRINSKEIPSGRGVKRAVIEKSQQKEA